MHSFRVDFTFQVPLIHSILTNIEKCKVFRIYQETLEETHVLLKETWYKAAYAPFLLSNSIERTMQCMMGLNNRDRKGILVIFTEVKWLGLF